MKKLLFAAVICSFVFAGCKTASSGNPNEVLSAWFDALAKKDMTTVKNLSTPESALLLGFLETGMNDPKTAKKMDDLDKSKMEFGDAVISGDNAKVPVKNKEKGNITNFPLKKINGQWKVAFDKGGISEMGMDAMKQGGMNTENIKDSISKGMEEMKNMNMDSLMREVKKAMDTSKMH